MTRGTDGLASILIKGVTSYAVLPYSINSSPSPPHFPLLLFESFFEARAVASSFKSPVAHEPVAFKETVVLILRSFFLISFFSLFYFIGQSSFVFRNPSNRLLEKLCHL